MQLDVAEEAAGVEPSNTSCEERATLVPSTPIEVDLATPSLQLESACPVDRSDRFFEFEVNDGQERAECDKAGEDVMENR